MSKKSAAEAARRPGAPEAAEPGSGVAPERSTVRPPAAVHVDLDGVREIAGAWGWDVPPGPDRIFETGLRAALDTFARNGVRATLFTVANSLDDPARRALLEEAVAAGHEIASHTLTHPNLLTLGRAERERELGESRRRLTGELGVPVEGFRAPGYRIDRECLEILSEAGYAWDSSAFPTSTMAERLETPVEDLLAPLPRFDGLTLGELPLPDHRPFPVPFGPSYALLFGISYFRWGVRRVARRGLPLVLLFHLVDFAEPMPPGSVPGLRGRILTLSAIRHDTKRRRCQAMLDEVRYRFEVTDTATLRRRSVDSP